MSDEAPVRTDPPTQPGQNFAVGRRGYDRAQVDEYVSAVTAEVTRLHHLVAGLDARIRNAEEEHKAAIEALHAEQAALSVGDRPTYQALGTRVMQILTLAEEEADAVRGRAHAEAEDLRRNLAQRVKTEVAEHERLERDRIEGMRLASEGDRADAAAVLRAAAEDAGRAAEAARAREQQAEARIAEAEHRAAAIVAEADRAAALRTADAEAEAEAAKSDARRRADSMVAEAELRASGMLDEARARIREEQDAAAARLDALTREHRDLLGRLGSIRDALAGLTGLQVPPSAAEAAAAVEAQERR